MATINLAPGTQYAVAARKRRLRLFLMSFLVIVVVALVWLAAFIYLQTLREAEEEVDARLRNVQMEIARLEENANRIVLFEQRLQTLDQLLDQHISWDPVLRGIEQLLPAPTVLTRLKVESGGGALEIGGYTPDIDQVAVALATLKSSAADGQVLFSSGTLNSVQREETSPGEGQPSTVRYVFSASLTFDSSMLKTGN